MANASGLVGTWKLTAIVREGTIDEIKEKLLVTINGNGTYSITDHKGGERLTTIGTYAVSGNRGKRFSDQGCELDTFTFAVDAERLTLSYDDGKMFQFKRVAEDAQGG